MKRVSKLSVSTLGILFLLASNKSLATELCNRDILLDGAQVSSKANELTVDSLIRILMDSKSRVNDVVDYIQGKVAPTTDRIQVLVRKKALLDGIQAKTQSLIGLHGEMNQTYIQLESDLKAMNSTGFLAMFRGKASSGARAEEGFRKLFDLRARSIQSAKELKESFGEFGAGKLNTDALSGEIRSLIVSLETVSKQLSNQVETVRPLVDQHELHVADKLLATNIASLHGQLQLVDTYKALSGPIGTSAIEALANQTHFESDRWSQLNFSFSSWTATRLEALEKEATLNPPELHKVSKTANVATATSEQALQTSIYRNAPKAKSFFEFNMGIRNALEAETGSIELVMKDVSQKLQAIKEAMVSAASEQKRREQSIAEVGKAPQLFYGTDSKHASVRIGNGAKRKYFESLQSIFSQEEATANERLVEIDRMVGQLAQAKQRMGVLLEQTRTVAFQLVDNKSDIQDAQKLAIKNALFSEVKDATEKVGRLAIEVQSVRDAFQVSLSEKKQQADLYSSTLNSAQIEHKREIKGAEAQRSSDFEGPFDDLEFGKGEQFFSSKTLGLTSAHAFNNREYDNGNSWWIKGTGFSRNFSLKVFGFQAGDQISKNGEQYAIWGFNRKGQALLYREQSRSLTGRKTFVIDPLDLKGFKKENINTLDGAIIPGTRVLRLSKTKNILGSIQLDGTTIHLEKIPVRFGFEVMFVQSEPTVGKSGKTYEVADTSGKRYEITSKSGKTYEITSKLFNDESALHPTPKRDLVRADWDPKDADGIAPGMSVTMGKERVAFEITTNANSVDGTIPEVGLLSRILEVVLVESSGVVHLEGVFSLPGDSFRVTFSVPYHLFQKYFKSSEPASEPKAKESKGSTLTISS